jgi:putative ABC transport system permease protein
MGTRQQTIEIIGYSLVLIVFIVGILNYVNTILCGIYARRQELSLLRITGMTEIQMYRMLIYEAMIIMLLIFITGCIFGIPFIKILFAAETGYDVSVDIIPVMYMFLVTTCSSSIMVLFICRMLNRKTPVEQLHDAN